MRRPSCARSAATVELTTDRDEGERLFAIRRAFHPALVATRHDRAHRGRRGAAQRAAGDVRRDRSASRRATASRSRRSRTPATATCTRTSSSTRRAVADGHVEVPDHVWAAADELFLDCLRLGGTLTGEHGVGLLKTPLAARRARRRLVRAAAPDQARLRPSGNPQPGQGLRGIEQPHAGAFHPIKDEYHRDDPEHPNDARRRSPPDRPDGCVCARPCAAAASSSASSMPPAPTRTASPRATASPGATPNADLQTRRAAAHGPGRRPRRPVLDQPTTRSSATSAPG